MHHLAMAQYHIDPLYAAWIDVLTEMIGPRSGTSWSGTSGDAEDDGRGMKRWNQEVIDTVPAERLLVW